MFPLFDTPAPTPSASPAFDPTTVTPGWVGFLITFLVALVTVAIIIDMMRRVRRVRYRAEIATMLDAEEAAEGDSPRKKQG